MKTTQEVLAAFNAGRLADAIDLVTQLVKQQPSEINARNLLCELLCFRGELARVDKQLETVALQEPKLAVSISLFRQLVRGALARQECFDNGRPPEVLAEPTPLIRLGLELWLARRENAAADADRLAAEIELARPKLSGTCNGQPFDDFRDASDLTSFFLEVLTSTGKYYWVPFDTVESVELHKPTRPREVLWRRARLIVRGGPDGEVYLPSIYPGSERSSDVALQTGRAVDWLGTAEGFTQGIGQRMFLAGDADYTLLDLQQLSFDMVGSGG